MTSADFRCEFTRRHAHEGAAPDCYSVASPSSSGARETFIRIAWSILSPASCRPAGNDVRAKLRRRTAQCQGVILAARSVVWWTFHATTSGTVLPKARTLIDATRSPHDRDSKSGIVRGHRSGRFTRKEDPAHRLPGGPTPSRSPARTASGTLPLCNTTRRKPFVSTLLYSSTARSGISSPGTMRSATPLWCLHRRSEKTGGSVTGNGLTPLGTRISPRSDQARRPSPTV